MRAKSYNEIYFLYIVTFRKSLGRILFMIAKKHRFTKCIVHTNWNNAFLKSYHLRHILDSINDHRWFWFDYYKMNIFLLWVIVNEVDTVGRARDWFPIGLSFARISSCFEYIDCNNTWVGNLLAFLRREHAISCKISKIERVTWHEIC